MNPNDAPSRDVLPIPGIVPPSLTTYDAKDPDAHYPPIVPLRPPPGAPNVLVVLIDDAGFGSPSAFGGPCLTPILECCGLAMPDVVDGVKQSPVPDVSMRYTFDNAKAPTRKETQYYEMLGTRGIWHQEWKAATEHGPVPIDLGHFDKDRWQLFHSDVDRAESERSRRMELYLDEKMVAQGAFRTQTGHYALCGEGLCIGYESGDAVSSAQRAVDWSPQASVDSRSMGALVFSGQGPRDRRDELTVVEWLGERRRAGGSHRVAG